MRDIGKDMRRGVSAVTSLNHNHKDNYKEGKGNNNTSRDRKSSSIGNSGSNNRDNPRFRDHKVNNKDNLRSDNHNALSPKEDLKEAIDRAEKSITVGGITIMTDENMLANIKEGDRVKVDYYSRGVHRAIFIVREV
ncbi:MAG TPA: hypothetical protein VN328_13005 [Thermodesulfovibrionales bacterium]|nr:hypothetical protein [Thermodesulfovibrionales bacterium]